MKQQGEKVSANELSGASVGNASNISEGVHISGVYHVQCHDADGNLLWSEECPNLVTTVGKNALLDNHLAGSAYTAAWYVGLISSASYTAVAAGDTMSSHTGWTESTAYSNSTRIAASWSAASAGSKALSSAAAFTCNATDTIKGCFLTTVSTKGGTTGTLYSAGLFSGGDQPVVSGNTLSVSYTATA